MKRSKTKVWLAMVGALTLLLVSTVSVKAYTFTLDLQGWSNSATATISDGYGAVTSESNSVSSALNPADVIANLANTRPGRDDSSGQPYASSYTSLTYDTFYSPPQSTLILDHYSYTDYYLSSYDNSANPDYFQRAEYNLSATFTFTFTVTSDEETPGPAHASVSVMESSYGLQIYTQATYQLKDGAIPLFSWSAGQLENTQELDLELDKAYSLTATFAAAGSTTSTTPDSSGFFPGSTDFTTLWTTLYIDVSEGTGNDDPPGPNPDPVPEPLSALLFALALPGLAAARRRSTL